MRLFVAVWTAFILSWVMMMVVVFTPVEAEAAPVTHRGGLYSNCVSYDEWQSLDSAPRRLSDLEHAFDITGFVVHVGDKGREMTKQYRWCGFGQSAVMVQIAFALNVRGEWMAFLAMQFDFRGYPFAHHPLDRATLV
jgi:hypothetical protein